MEEMNSNLDHVINPFLASDMPKVNRKYLAATSLVRWRVLLLLVVSTFLFLS
jgi:hypothetical protein